MDGMDKMTTVSEYVRFVGGQNDNISLLLEPNSLGDTVVIVEDDLSAINIDDLFFTITPAKTRRGIYRRGPVVDRAVLYVWEGWNHE